VFFHFKQPAESVALVTMGRLNFQTSPFASGGMRHAYTAEVQTGTYLGFPEGTKLVVKALKSDLWNSGHRIDQRDIAMQDRACKLSEDFNKKVQPVKDGSPCLLHMRRAKLDKCEESFTNSDGVVVFAKGENCATEMVVNGKWEKFNSNSGWSSQDATLPDCFSHWTYWYTSGKELVCDLQGHRGTPDGPTMDGESCYYYLLTDPAMISSTRKYGMTDTGASGMEQWFSGHTCNSMCNSLGIDTYRPTARRRTALTRGSISVDDL